ncbi:plasmid replication protein [Azospirillum sp.]|uniref:plasmid replication protein n=1 Tax=Azospirillum sp. TaxID=34012 RepID=UPI002D50CD10|nr:plasmid replication protein [Azospirillum sp.]HYF89511.1 plasmid replication protein [Azospirillum sp.]
MSSNNPGGKGDLKQMALPLQFALFEIDEPDDAKRTTHFVGLYDVAPKWVFFASDVARSNGRKRSVGAGEVADSDAGKPRFLRQVKREFVFNDKTYSLKILPARIERRVKDGGTEVIEEIDTFPGEKEQVVEEVIRRLAAEKARLSTGEKDSIVFKFTLYEVLQELRRVKHTLSLPELKEALLVLRRSTIVIAEKGGKNALLDSSVFPQLWMRNHDVNAGGSPDENGRADVETAVQFNWMVENTIRSVEQQRISYEWLMRIENPFSRWLFKRVAFTLLQRHHQDRSSIEITAREIMRDSGMTEWARWSNMLRWISDIVDVLKKVGALAEVEREVVKVGKRHDDIIFRLRPSDLFLHQIAEAHRVSAWNRREIARVTAAEQAPGNFVRVDAKDLADTRRRRKAALTQGVSQNTAET